MPEYIVVWRFRNREAAMRGDIGGWRVASGKVYTEKGLADADASLYNEEFTNCEYRVATIE